MSDDTHERSTTERGYDRLVDHPELERWASPWADSPYQEHYVWPAVRSLLPALEGLSVLDAGCGVGHYTARFLEAGADVVGVDVSTDALAVARERCGDRATFHRQDLADPLAIADDGAFDLVFCNLVLDHLEAWRPPLREFHRVLASGGVLVFATVHPFRRYLNHREELASYHETEGYVVEWGDTDAEIRSYYRPVGEVVESLADAGFAITDFLEARPEPAYADHEPERHEAALEQPDTLCVRARAMDA